MPRMLRRMLHLLRPGRAAGLAEEIAFHLERKQAEEEMSQAAAERAFGNDLALRERSRDAWGWLWLEQLGQDLRYVLRQARRAPAFFALAILILALAIGANTALYSVLDAVLFHPPAYAHPEQLFVLDGVMGVENRMIAHDFLVTPAAWLHQLPSIAESALYIAGPGDLHAPGAPPVSVPIAEVSPGFFHLLGVSPRGAGFVAADASAGRSYRIILSPALAGRLGNVKIGAAVELAGTAYTVIGITPAGFDFPHTAEAWIPLPAPWSFASEPLELHAIYFTPLVRLRPGTTPATLRRQLLAAHAVPPGWPAANVVLTPIARYRLADTAPVLWLLFGAVGVVLLIACANVANLQLARALERRQEMSVRLALGASRGRLARQQLAESLTLAAAATVGGCGLAALALPALQALIPAEVPLHAPVALNPAVLALTLAATALTVVLTGVPAALWARPHHRDRPRLRAALAVVEIALAMLLLAGAGLLLASLWRLTRVDPGFAPEGLLTAKISLAAAAYRQPAARLRFFDQLLARAQALPGVTAAALGNNLPMNVGSSFTVEVKAGSRDSGAYFTSISPGYFSALGIPLLSGRNFNAGDRPTSTNVVIVSRGLAEALWPRGSPVGRQLFQPGNPGQPWTALTVVGMVGDTRLSLAQPAAQTLYFPLAQATYADVAILLRARSNPDALVAPLRQAVAALDPSLPLADLAAMPALLRRNTAAARFRTLLLGLFALLALLLSVAGIAAVTAFSVTRHTRDYGVRMALGAAPAAIAREVLGGSLRPLMLGLAVGMAAALALTRVLAHWLYAMGPRDPLTFAGAAVLLAAACLAACWWPARRAARLDPALTLRHD